MTKGRKEGQERICPVCNYGSNKSIEDEVHFLCSCNWRKYKQLREKFFNEIINIIPYFGNLDNKQKIYVTKIRLF